MSDALSPLVLDLPCEQAVRWLTQRVGQAGLSVVRTFDLQVARQAQTACPCPQHGTEQCDCQMVVLLVYQQHHRPVTLIAHGNGGRTWFSVVDTPQQRADPELESAICRSLDPVVPEDWLSQMHVAPDEA